MTRIEPSSQRRFSEELFKQYAATGHESVEGWMGAPGIFKIAQALATVQDERNIGGSLCEIGIYHGRFFLVLYLLLRRGETAVAVDLFGDPSLEPNGSVGDAEIFLRNVDRHAGDRSAVKIVRGDTTRLIPADLSTPAQAPFRLFSVDGGHSPAVTFHDLELAEATLAKDGIIILDDYFNHAWPGVSEGVNQYFARRTTRLRPVLIGYNKMLFAFSDSAQMYRDRLQTLLSDIFLWKGELFDTEVLVLQS